MAELISLQRTLISGLQSALSTDGNLEVHTLLLASNTRRENSVRILSEQFQRMSAAAPILELPCRSGDRRPPQRDGLPEPLAEGIAIDSYDTEAGDRGLEKGDHVFITEYRNAAWYWGHRDNPRRCGLFPAYYVKIVKTQTHDTRVPQVDIEPPIRAIALCPFTADRSAELDIEPNDLLLVTMFKTYNWWKGRNTRTGWEGLFPQDCVEVLQVPDRRTGELRVPYPRPSALGLPAIS